MDWFNFPGFCVVAMMLLPNIIYAIGSRKELPGVSIPRFIEVLEQVGRYGCMSFLVFNFPGSWKTASADTLFLMGNGALLVSYLVGWAVYWRKDNMAKALLLSILPTGIFLFSGVLLGSLPLLLCAILFGVCHIYISVKSSLERRV